jgi:hypothetical protein
LLDKVPLGVTASIFPEVAPAGTVVVITALADTVKIAGVPLKVTLVATHSPACPRIRGDRSRFVTEFIAPPL